ncbi:ribonuclease, Rne/Rng family [Aliiroseovarius sediminilitoris]|uniref:Ribonuclease, Rne/Rng family n=1 Tax=Aliiroseovarius sediminilitoris TaxID=1173584 RepID=A0A1I0NTT6_9RHOB|nr:ribonuclease E/G [Aliiroseovarius sediminilitoris]SEW04307.1 ribonuclease, Rne/Rng family [Aliiroseovarius sediminilitoris]
MKGSVIALDRYKGRLAAAHIVDGRLEDLLIEPPEDVTLPGAIFRAVCDRPLKGQGGMMLRLADGETGFLRQGKGLSPGQPLLVQVTGFAEDGKAVPVTRKLLFKSRYAIVTPDAPGINVSRAIRDDDERVRLLDIAHGVMDGVDEGLILRSAAATGSDDEIADDIAQMLSLSRAVRADATGQTPELLLDGADPHHHAWREWAKPDQMDDGDGAFDRHGVSDLIADHTRAHVPLSGGACAFVEPTRALVAVDVNTGGDTSPAAGLKANIATAQALPRALRCRGLGGQIVIDFAPSPKKDRRQIEQALRNAFRADRIETSLVGWTTLGNFELQRKRERMSLRACLEGPK